MRNVVSRTAVPGLSGRVGLPGLRASIAALVPGLRPSDAKVMRVVLDDPGFVRSATTEETARRAGVSPATVVRAARAAGFRGISDLKLALAEASGRDDSPAHSGKLDSDATVAEVCATVLSSHADSVRSASATLAPSALSSAVSLISAASEVLVVGVGTSAAPAADAAYRWATIGCRAQAPRDTRETILKARLLKADDALVAISHTGSSAETLNAVDAAAAAGAHVVAITSFAASPLVDRAEVVLVAGGPDLGMHMAAASSRLAHLAVIDILHAGVALADLSRARRALRLSAELADFTEAADD
jgi:RpiR family transcriptional regulator, carbohydrate utilization regulator